MKAKQLMMRLSVIFFCAMTARLAVGSCGVLPASLLDGRRREYTGIYENKVYHYKIAIPVPLVGYDPDDPFYQRGFAVLLGQPRRAYIDVGAEANSLEFGDPESMAKIYLESLRHGGGTILSTQTLQTKLGDLAAVRSVSTYICPHNSNVSFVQDTVIALSPSHDYIYNLTLYSISPKYDADKRILDKMLRSWIFTGK